MAKGPLPEKIAEAAVAWEVNPRADGGKSLESLKENDEVSLSYQEALCAVKARKNLKRHFLYLPVPLVFFILFAWCALLHVPIT
ncbi:hypothetical protein As57867_006973, partial [Aphanomyces stellatus]